MDEILDQQAKSVQLTSFETKSGELPQDLEGLKEWIMNCLSAPIPRKRQLALIMSGIHSVIGRINKLANMSKEVYASELNNIFRQKVEQLHQDATSKYIVLSSTYDYFEKTLAELTEKAHRDPQTNLINYKRFLEKLGLFLGIEQRIKGCIVGFIDCAEFKKINDLLGHAKGDEILNSIARILESYLRPGDLVTKERRQEPRMEDLHSRHAGDQFVFMMPDPTLLKVAKSIGERFQQSMESYGWSPEVLECLGHPVYADIGIVWYKMDPLKVRAPIAERLAKVLVEAADHCMYEAKERAKIRANRGGKHAGKPVSRLNVRQVRLEPAAQKLVLEWNLDQEVFFQL